LNCGGRRTTERKGLIMSKTPRTDNISIDGDRETVVEFCKLLEAELADMTAERDAWQAKFVRRLQAVDELTARADLAERQVAVLCTRLCTLVDCVRCPAKKEGCETKCDITTAAWSRAEAVKGGKG